MAPIFHRHHKGAETAYHTIPIVLDDVLDIEGARGAALEQQGQAVDDEPFGNGLVAGGGHLAALIVGAVTGDVDDLARGVPLPFLQQTHAEVDRAGNGGARSPPDRGAAELFGEGDRILGPLQLGPRHDDLLNVRAGPFHIADGDAPEHAGSDHLMHERRAKGFHEALPLKCLLVGIHRVGDVDRQDERDVYIGASPLVRKQQEAAPESERESKRAGGSHTNLRYRASPL